MQLYQHQKDALEKTKNLTHVAYYHDMGLGKTFTGAEKMMQLGARVNLIICQKSKVDDWHEHMSIYYAMGKPNCIYNLTEAEELGWFLTNIKEHKTSHTHTGIINYDLVWRKPELLQLHDFTLLLDESSSIQHKTAKRTKFVIKMRPKNVILLSGTPVGGKYENLLTQLHLLGWNITEKMFWSHYVDWEWIDLGNGFFDKKINGYKNIERLKRKLRQYGCDFLKTEEVMDLPEQIDQTIRVPTSKEYRKFKKDKIVVIDGIKLKGDLLLTAMMYERQLCGQYNQNKLDAFRDLAESASDRLIVFYNFTDEMLKMTKICMELNRSTSYVNGQIKDLDAYDKYDDSITFIQYQAGSMGLNLQKANKIIYFSPPLSSELFEQSKKRIHRIGQNRSCFYYYLTCRNSIEEKIYATLAKRRDYTEELFKEDR